MYEIYMVQGICNFYSLCLCNHLSDIFLFFSGSTRILFPPFKHLNYTSLQCEMCVYNNFFKTLSHFKCCHKNLTSIKPLFIYATICSYALYLFTTDALVSFQLIPENNIRFKVSESLTINFQLTLIKSYSFNSLIIFFQLKCFFSILSLTKFVYQMKQSKFLNIHLNRWLLYNGHCMFKQP